MAAMVAHACGIRRVETIQCIRYDDETHVPEDRARVTGNLPHLSLAADDNTSPPDAVFIIDDMFQSGITMWTTKNIVSSLTLKSTDIQCFSLCRKEDHNLPTVPNMLDGHVLRYNNEEWVVFPYEDWKE